MATESAPNMRERSRRKTHARLIRSAHQVFARRGLLAARTADVAAAAGVSHGTVFLHFRTREKLLVAVIRELGEEVAGRVHRLAAGTQSLREVLASHLEALRRREPFYARLIAEAPQLPCQARNTLLGIQSVLSHHIHRAACSEAARLRPVPVHLLFNTWIGLVHHYVCNRDLFAPGGSAIERCGDELLDHFMSLVSEKSGVSK